MPLKIRGGGVEVDEFTDFNIQVVLLITKNGTSALTQHCRVSAMPRGISLAPPAECSAPKTQSRYTGEEKRRNVRWQV